MKICIDPLLDFSRIEQSKHTTITTYSTTCDHFLFQFLPAANEAVGRYCFSRVCLLSARVVTYPQDYTPRTTAPGPESPTGTRAPSGDPYSGTRHPMGPYPTLPPAPPNHKTDGTHPTGMLSFLFYKEPFKSIIPVVNPIGR